MRNPTFAADTEPADLEYEGSPVVLAALLTLLRWLIAGAAAATLTALAQDGVRVVPWQDPVAGSLLAVYALGTTLLFLLIYLARRHAFWLIDLSLAFDLLMLMGLSLATGGATALLVLPVLFAIGILRSIWAGLLAVTLYGVHLVPMWPPAHDLFRLPSTSQAVLFGVYTILCLVWVSLVAGSNAQVVRQHARKASQTAKRTAERYRLALQRAK
ncbi:MAG TPA: hypothetical protein VKY74_07155, partial [Chloroflexia bacterium]|nr:hypothetical protein [Chloroflexia bacterium]